MRRAQVNGVELEYEVVGVGEPVLLVSPVIADGFLPLLSEPALADRYQVIRYHKRGWGGSTHTPPPVSIATHAADAAALLEQLGVPRAHVAGHSTGAVVAAQLAIDSPETVHTLTLLEPLMLSVPSGEAVLQQVGPAFEAYGNGDHEEAWARFLSAATGLGWETCRTLLERRIPGSVAHAVKDADTLFGVELPAVAEWAFGLEQAAAIRCPVLSVLGTDTLPLSVDVARFLRSSVPHVEDGTIDGVGHLLHIQRPEPVARVLAGFLGDRPVSGG
jgi:pimeloyl-ACP methyl ester carboxylesterase